MVFIVLGAVKAAKAARLEYVKDKKRNSVITAVDGSHDMMADRGSSSSQRQPNTSTDWWGTLRTEAGPVPAPDAPDNHSGAGAWSRDHTMQQVADAGAERPTSGSSASTTTQLSLPVPQSPSEHSAAGSPSHSVKHSSQRSLDMNLQPSVSRDPAARRSRSTDANSSPLGHSSQEFGQLSLEESGASAERNGSCERKEGSNAVDESTSRGEVSMGVPPTHASRTETNSREELGRMKPVQDGSFEAALRSKPTMKEERKQEVKPTSSGDLISALSGNASKRYRMRSSRRRDNVPAFAGSGTDQGNIAQQKVEETTPSEAISALARNASKGLRRGSQRPPNVPLASASVRTSSARDARSEPSVGNIDGVRGQKDVPRTGSSAFSGAATKKRIGRRIANRPESTESISTAEPELGTVKVSQQPTDATQASTAMAGSSMYATGSMKKRTSRR